MQLPRTKFLNKFVVAFYPVLRIPVRKHVNVRNLYNLDVLQPITGRVF